MRIISRKCTSGVRAALVSIVLGATILCIQADPLLCQEKESAQAGPDPAPAAQAPKDSAQVAPALPDSIVAVYYHYTLRCRTCLMMEACARDVIKKKFPRELVKGKIRWRHVDFEQPEHSGIEKKYQLDGSTLVLSHWKNKKEISWVRMDELWEISDDPEAVSDRVREQLKLCLAGRCSHETPDAPNEEEKSERNRGVRRI